MRKVAATLVVVCVLIVGCVHRAYTQSPEEQVAVVTTDKGQFVIEFYPNAAPVAVKNFTKLIKQKFYDGLTFHRKVDQDGLNIIQGGCPKGDGTGGPGWNIIDEYTNPNQRAHLRGTVAMARANMPNSAGSQFYICLKPQPHLDGNYTTFGRVIHGMDIVDLLQMGDFITDVRLEAKSKVIGPPTGTQEGRIVVGTAPTGTQEGRIVVGTAPTGTKQEGRIVGVQHVGKGGTQYVTGGKGGTQYVVGKGGVQHVGKGGAQYVTGGKGGVTSGPAPLIVATSRSGVVSDKSRGIYDLRQISDRRDLINLYNHWLSKVSPTVAFGTSSMVGSHNSPLAEGSIIFQLDGRSFDINDDRERAAFAENLCRYPWARENLGGAGLLEFVDTSLQHSDPQHSDPNSWNEKRKHWDLVVQYQQYYRKLNFTRSERYLAGDAMYELTRGLTVPPTFPDYTILPSEDLSLPGRVFNEKIDGVAYLGFAISFDNLRDILGKSKEAFIRDQFLGQSPLVPIDYADDLYGREDGWTWDKRMAEVPGIGKKIPSVSTSLPLEFSTALANLIYDELTDEETNRRTRENLAAVGLGMTSGVPNVPIAFHGSIRIEGTDDESEIEKTVLFWKDDEHFDKSWSISRRFNLDGDPLVLSYIPKSEANWGGECAVRVRVYVRLLSLGTIDVKFSAKFYEGWLSNGEGITDFHDDDKDSDRGTTHFWVHYPPVKGRYGNTVSGSIDLYNAEDGGGPATWIGGGDTAKVTVRLSAAMSW